MRIMLDTNVLISSIIFKSKIMNELIAAILKDHRLVLSSFVIEELKTVVQRKFEGRSAELNSTKGRFYCVMQNGKTGYNGVNKLKVSENWICREKHEREVAQGSII